MKNDFVCLGNLIGREIKIFLKDKASVFFSILAPIIILLLYFLFLGDMQVSSVEATLKGTGVSRDLIKSFIDGWMLAGVVSVACITISFSAYNVVLSDKECGALDDLNSSPVKRWVINLSYYIYNFTVTMIICFILLVIVFIYVAITGWYLSAGETFAVIGMIILSIFSSTLVTTAICGFVKTVNAHSALVGILSAVSGFLIGAYMPIGMYPQAVQYIVLFIPGTYSAGVFRNLFMNGALNEIGKIAPYHKEALQDAYTLNLDFFGDKIGADIMVYALIAMIAIFAVLNVVLAFVLPKLKYLSAIKKPKNKKTKDLYE